VLQDKGHFLKGSSGVLGVSRVSAICEQIQHCGDMRDEDAGVTLSASQALERIAELLTTVKKEHETAEKWLRDWYKEKGVTTEPDLS
jgi:HPt (histidine-containing phosphotransfer) domain-containing protein